MFHLCSTKSGVDTDKRRKKTLFFFLTGAFEAPPLSKKKRKNLMKDVFGLEEVLWK